MSPTELIGIAIGWVLLALGGASVGAWALRRRQSTPLLLLFGVWCLMYGTRLIAAQPAIRVSLGGPPLVWSYVVAFITYGINIPTALFFEALVGAGWKQSVRRMWQVQAAFAAGAIGAGLLLGQPNAAMRFNNPLVVLGLAIQSGNLLLYRRRLSPLITTPVLVAAGLTLLFFVLNENLGRPIVPSMNLEPVGVLVFVVALAHGVIGTVVRGEADLLAVQRELETARRIQQSLLPPHIPSVRGLSVSVQYLPMTAVGGDLYDFVDLGPSAMGMLLADVSGHGVPAALVASMVKLAFMTQADRARDPAQLMIAMNRLLSGAHAHAFVTAVYAVIDTERRVITVANAGHPGLLIGRATRTVDEIDTRGLMLGFSADATYVNTTVEMRDSDIILMYTDGVTEAQNRSGEFFDADRVKQWLTPDRVATAADLAAAALHDLKRWRRQGFFDDDVTFMVATVAHPAEPPRFT